MEVISLHGTDDRLYQLVARLVMDPDVLRQNNNYPFKTTSEYVWHLCVGDDGGVVGFLPVKATDRGFYIDNYYVGGDEQAVLGLLIGHVLLQTTRPVTIPGAHNSALSDIKRAWLYHIHCVCPV